MPWKSLKLQQGHGRLQFCRAASHQDLKATAQCGTFHINPGYPSWKLPGTHPHDSLPVSSLCGYHRARGHWTTRLLSQDATPAAAGLAAMLPKPSHMRHPETFRRGSHTTWGACLSPWRFKRTFGWRICEVLCNTLCPFFETWPVQMREHMSCSS